MPPKKRPDVAARLQARNHYYETTVKCSLRRLRCAESLYEAMVNMLRSIHPLAIRGALVVQSHLLDCLRNDRELPPLVQADHGKTFFSKCFRLSYDGDDTLKDTFYMYHHPLERKHDVQVFQQLPMRRNLAHQLIYAANQFYTACENHVVRNFNRRLLQFIKRKLHICGIVFHSKRKYSFLCGVMDVLLSGGYDNQQVDPLEKIEDLLEKHSSSQTANKQHFLSIVSSAWNTWRTGFEHCATIFPVGNDIDKKKKWDALLLWTYHLRCDLDHDRAVYLPREPQDKVPNGIYRTYSLLPLPSFACKHITVDTTILYRLLQTIKHDPIKKEQFSQEMDAPRYCNNETPFLQMDSAEFTSHRTRHWKELFPGLTRFCTRNKSFKHIIQTDGTSVSIGMGVPVPEGQVKQRTSSKKRRRQSGGNVSFNVGEIPDMDIQKLIKVDPGRRDIVRAAIENTSTDKSKVENTSTDSKNEDTSKDSKDENTSTNSSSRDKNVHIPNQLFQQWRKTAQIRRQTDSWMKKYGLDQLNKLPTGKVVDLDQWSEFLDGVYAWMDRFIPFFQWKTLQRLRLRSYQQRYYALDKGCRHVLGWSKGNPRTKQSANTVVAFGHNESTTGFGYAAGPCQSFKERLKRYVHVVSINEYGTSQICYKCHGRLETPQMRNAKKKKFLPSTEFKTCPRCLNSKGKKLYIQRDINAAQNIGQIFWASYHGESRPTCFCPSQFRT